jgi:hypothetical protein
MGQQVHVYIEKECLVIWREIVEVRLDFDELENGWLVADGFWLSPHLGPLFSKEEGRNSPAIIFCGALLHGGE